MRRVRRSRQSRRAYDEASQMFLRTGMHWAFMGRGYADSDTRERIADIDVEGLLPVMQADWHAHRAEIEAEHFGWNKNSCDRPWAFWKFDVDREFPTDWPEWRRLLEIGEVTIEQATEAARKEVDYRHGNYWHSPAFRRCFAWYWLRGIERDPNLCEVAQLVGLHRQHGDVLSDIERGMLDGDKKLLTDKSRHLEDPEKLLLGIKN